MMKLLVITFTGMKFFACYLSADIIQNNFGNKHGCYIMVYFLIKKSIVEVSNRVSN